MQWRFAWFTIAITVISAPSFSAADPCGGKPGVGTVCADGTVYSGLSPDGNVPMYAMPCDLGMKVSRRGGKWICSGKRESYEVRDFVGSSGVLSLTNGKANTEALVASSAKIGKSLDCANACAFQNFGGHKDWYLPSIHELAVMCNGTTKEPEKNCPAAVAIGNLSMEKTSWYCSSSREKEPASFMFNIRFSDGIHSFADPVPPKHTTAKNLVRCVRKGAVH